MITTDQAKLMFDVVQTVLICIVGVMNWLNTRQRVTTQSITGLKEGIDERIDHHAERLTRLEQDFKNTPGHKDLAEIYQELRSMAKLMSDINANLAGQQSTLSAVKGQVERMDSYWRSKN